MKYPKKYIKKLERDKRGYIVIPKRYYKLIKIYPNFALYENYYGYTVIKNILVDLI